MTELQMGLIGLGIAAVAGVLGYNKWQESRQRKLAEAVLKPQHEDVLLAKGDAARSEAGRSEPQIDAPAAASPVGRREPVLGGEPAADAGPGEVVPVFVDGPDAESAEVSGNAQEATSIAGERPVGPVPGSLLDPRLELIAAFELFDAVPAGRILYLRADDFGVVSKPVRWVGYNEGTREWERLEAGGELPVRRLRVGLQLVDRTGPISEADIAAFTGAAQALAGELPAVLDLPSTRLLDQAAELDRFSAAVDLEIGVNLVSRGVSFSGTKIRALAEAAGMTLGDDGVFTRCDDDGRPQFTLHNLESTQFTPDGIRNLSTHGLTFVLDVPRVDHGERVFAQMAELAKRFAETLQGTLVDDNRQPLSDVQLDHIRREFIGKPQATMAAYGLPAGSAQALRLFS